MANRSLWRWFYKWPIPRTAQMLFAEALSQTLVAGMPVSQGIHVATKATPSARFRASLREMAAHTRVGYSLATSLSRTGVAVRKELLAALEVGEQRGGLSEHLAALARQWDPQPAARLAAAVGRKPEAVRFAATLARLLKESLTVYLIEDAAQLTAGAGSRFSSTMQSVADAMRNGATFAEALSCHPRTFDRLFVALVGAPDRRDCLRAILTRIGEGA